MHFWSFGAKYWPFWTIWCYLCPTKKNNMNEVPRWFSDMKIAELLLPLKIIRMFGLQMAILPPNRLSWAHRGLDGSFGALLVSGCGARAVSRKTPIYYIIRLKFVPISCFMTFSPSSTLFLEYYQDFLIQLYGELHYIILSELWYDALLT